MSYIITSNIDVNHQNKNPTPNTIGLNKAFSYTNAMDNVPIESNSEIAVASIKVNREGVFTLSQDNNKFALYHGAEVDTVNGNPSSTLGYMEELSQPVIGTLRGESGGPSSTFNTDDFAKSIQESLRLFTFHPSYQKSDLNGSGVIVSASRIANEGFKGFNFTFNQYSGSIVTNKSGSLVAGAKIAPARTSLIPPIRPVPETFPEIPTVLQTTLNGTACLVENTQALSAQNAPNAMWATILGDRPLSLIGASGGGQVAFDIRKVFDGANGVTDELDLKHFSVGLTRAQKNFQDYADNTTQLISPFPAPFVEEDANYANGYYDWEVRSVPDLDATGNIISELRIFHAVCVNPPGDNQIVTKMVEVPYVSGLAGNARYQPNNASKSVTGKPIESIIFEANGETMTIKFVDSDGVSTGMEISSKAYTGSTHKSQRLKCVNAMCWSLYPKVMVRGYGGPTDTGTYNSVTITKYDGVLPEGHYYGGIKRQSRPRYMEPQSDGLYDNMNDLFSYCQNLGSGEYFRQIELQDCRTEAISYHDAGNNTVVPSQRNASTLGLAGGKTYIDISNVLIMSSSIYYGTSLGIPNTKNILGFPNNGVIVGKYGPAGWDGIITTQPEVRTSANDLLTSNYNSDEVPKMISGESTFVRLRNLATQSFNVANRSFSKILYHIPKFDNTGEEVGSLFFEPNERIYVKLNNSTALNLNSFDVDLVNGREILSPSYTGTTVVCFHIRKSRI